MEKLKKFRLNNKVLNDFDKLMSCHLDEIDILEIDELITNPNLYNVISLCTNVKKLVITGSLRIDVNKIIYNICKPEKIESIVFDSVKLPTNKAFSKFTNLKIIHIRNIDFSNTCGFLLKIPNKNSIISLNLVNSDFGRKSISILSQFKNLKQLNIDRLKNCVFDDFSFLTEIKTIDKFEFINNSISFTQIENLCKGVYEKNIVANIELNSIIDNINKIKIYNDKICLSVSSNNLDVLADNISFYKIDELNLILNCKINLDNYIRTFKKVKEKVNLSITDIAFLNSEDAKRYKDKLGVKYVDILGDFEKEKVNQTYKITEYLQIYENINEILNNVSSHSSDFDKFNELYNYFKINFTNNDEIEDLKDAIFERQASYNLYAILMNSLLKILGFDSKVICGEVEGKKDLLWNQVKIEDTWYNFDLAYDINLRTSRKLLQHMNRGNLLGDKLFYKNHIPLEGNPEMCISEIDKTNNKNGFLEKIFEKIKNIFGFNKPKAFPITNDKN